MMTKPISEMTNDEFYEFVINQQMQGWIPLKMYLRLFPVETKVAITQRLRRNHWQRGTHYNVPPGGEAWVNLTAIREWVTSKEEKVLLASESLPETVVSLK